MQNDDERNLVPVWALQRRANQCWTEDESDDKRQPRTDNRQPPDFTPLFAGEQLLCFRATQEHEQQQTQPVDEVEHIAFVYCTSDDPHKEWDPSQKRWTKHNPRQNLAYHFWLAQLHE